MNKKICYIIGASPINDFIDFIINDDDLIIGVDGGYELLKSHQIKPNVIIGDFDSLGYVPQVDDVQIIKLPKKKDDTDTLQAIKVGIDRGYNTFYLYNVTGGRIDHTIANITCLNMLANLGKKGYIVTTSNNKITYLTAIKETAITLNNKTGYISIFSLCDESIITLKNLKYEINDYHLKNIDSIGVSNEFINKEAMISVSQGTILLIY